MRDFTWNYFSMTGDVDAYLFYKEINAEENEAEMDNPDLLEIEDEE